MSDFEVKWFEFPFRDKKQKRYTKEEKERDCRRTEKDSIKSDIPFYTSNSVRRIRGLNSDQLIPSERRQLIIAFLADACRRLVLEKQKKGE